MYTLIFILLVAVFEVPTARKFTIRQFIFFIALGLQDESSNHLRRLALILHHEYRYLCASTNPNYNLILRLWNM